jgi:hypothetical protein
MVEGCRRLFESYTVEEGVVVVVVLLLLLLLLLCSWLVIDPSTPRVLLSPLLLSRIHVT